VPARRGLWNRNSNLLGAISGDIGILSGGRIGPSSVPICRLLARFHDGCLDVWAAGNIQDFAHVIRIGRVVLGEPA
jgi:hypothetical protein